MCILLVDCERASRSINTSQAFGSVNFYILNIAFLYTYIYICILYMQQWMDKKFLLDCSECWWRSWWFWIERFDFRNFKKTKIFHSAFTLHGTLWHTTGFFLRNKRIKFNPLLDCFRIRSNAISSKFSFSFLWFKSVNLVYISWSRNSINLCTYLSSSSIFISLLCLCLFLLRFLIHK